MEINPQRSIRPIQKTKRSSRAGRSEIRPAALDERLFLGSELLAAIESGLAALPEVRQELVEVGKQLVEDPNYPSAEELEDLAQLTLKNVALEGLAEEGKELEDPDGKDE